MDIFFPFQFRLNTILKDFASMGANTFSISQYDFSSEINQNDAEQRVNPIISYPEAKAFQDKFNFPFPLNADEDKSVIKAFGVWGPKKFMGREYDGIHRTTFVIDENGIVDDIITDVKTKAHAAQILTRA